MHANIELFKVLGAANSADIKDLINTSVNMPRTSSTSNANHKKIKLSFSPEIFILLEIKSAQVEFDNLQTHAHKYFDPIKSISHIVAAYDLPAGFELRNVSFLDYDSSKVVLAHLWYLIVTSSKKLHTCKICKYSKC